MTRDRLAERLRLCLVGGPGSSSLDFANLVREALAGGVTCVQLRAKNMSDSELFKTARGVRHLCHDASALFLVNDRLDIALAANADGVHLGVDDLPVEAARSLAGPNFVIGFSPETDQQAEEAISRGATYLGVGPVFGTTSKSDAGEAIGLDTLRRRIGLAGIPVIGIGGITRQNAASVIETGADGIAVVSAILNAPDPGNAAFELSETIATALRDR